MNNFLKSLAIIPFSLSLFSCSANEVTPEEFLRAIETIENHEYVSATETYQYKRVLSIGYGIKFENEDSDTIDYYSDSGKWKPEEQYKRIPFFDDEFNGHTSAYMRRLHLGVFKISKDFINYIYLYENNCTRHYFVNPLRIEVEADYVKNDINYKGNDKYVFNEFGYLIKFESKVVEDDYNSISGTTTEEFLSTIVFN